MTLLPIAKHISLAQGFALVAAMAPPNMAAARPTAEVLLDKVPFASSTKNWFSTPIAYSAKQLFFVTVEEGGLHRWPLNLRTVIWHGDFRGDTALWKRRDVDSRTATDEWHTQPSVGIDEKGYIHVAYNMHNLPWQYVRSVEPFSIESFRFFGEVVSLAVQRAQYQNSATRFPDDGTGDIPGTQITYPAFFTNQRDELYLTYRAALYPNASFPMRAFSAVVAKYNAESEQWKSLGPAPRFDANRRAAQWRGRVVNFVASETGWTAYPPRLTFDEQNDVHACLLWQRGVAGKDLEFPTYFNLIGHALEPRTRDGQTIASPLRPGDSAVAGYGDRADEKFYAPCIPVLPDKRTPAVIVRSHDGGPQIIRWSSESEKWMTLGKAPAGSWSSLQTEDGAFWFFANKLQVFRSTTLSGKREKIYSSRDDFCLPKATYAEEENAIFILSQSCQGGDARVVVVRNVVEQ